MAGDLIAATTRPSRTTGDGRSRAGAAHVRWVFPEAVVTPFHGRHVVGRDVSCDTILRGLEISRRHAEFRIEGLLLSVRDLDSRNGVFVNGVAHAEAPLAPGYVLRCGEWVGVVCAGSDTSGLREIAPDWFGGSTLAAVAESVRRVATTDLSIVVQGETGTGKEGMARAIHHWSCRPGPFVAVNCATLPVHLAEAELFGHRRGAFTGADNAGLGLFRAAHTGTIFLDELLDLPAVVQPKLLRVLEEREVLPLGETKPVAVDVRVVASSQESLSSAVASQRFRADLLARLDGLTVVLPPLRTRREDIAPLLGEFLRQHTGGRPPEIESKLVEALCVYDWPLNVRELLLFVRRTLSLHRHEKILLKRNLPDQVRSWVPGEASSGLSSLRPKSARRRTDHEAEFEAIIDALRSHDGSVAKAAEAVGVSRARLSVVVRTL